MNANVNEIMRDYIVAADMPSEFLYDISEVTTLFLLQAVHPLQGSLEDLSAAPDGRVLLAVSWQIEAGAVVVNSQVWYKQQGVVAQLTPRRIRAEYPAEQPLKEAKYQVRVQLTDMLTELTGIQPGPWGLLRGVRPVKLAHKLLNNHLSPSETTAKLISRYRIAEEKGALLTDIACRQRALPLFTETDKRTVSIYVGIPFCPSRCLYCSFPGFVLPGRAESRLFLQKLEEDMQACTELIDKYGLDVQNIYVGGGTPTSLHENDFAKLLQLIKTYLVTRPVFEYTVEAGRPDSLSTTKIAIMQDAAVNRVSINPQSMQQKTLAAIGRHHTVQAVIDMFTQLRQTDAFVINMDIIAGLPGETASDMADTLRQIIALQPDNLTVHTLAVKRGSQLKTAIDKHAQPPLPDQLTVEHMLALAEQAAREELQMQPYYLYRQKYMTGNMENIGYARPGTECLYNVQIMEERQTIIGIGSAATTKAIDQAAGTFASCYHPKDIKTYLNSLPQYVAARAALLAELFANNEEE